MSGDSDVYVVTLFYWIPPDRRDIDIRGESVRLTELVGLRVHGRTLYHPRIVYRQFNWMTNPER